MSIFECLLAGILFIVIGIEAIAAVALNCYFAYEMWIDK